MTIERLRQIVLDELACEPGTNLASINVVEREGAVTLIGQVESYAIKWAAELAAARVLGVKAVASEVKVSRPSNARQSDEAVAARARHALFLDVFVPQKVKVIVEHGWLTLTGDLERSYQKQAAEANFRTLCGVIGVTNAISIKPGVEAYNLRNTTVAALGRTTPIEADAVNVTIILGKFTISGRRERADRRVNAWLSRLLQRSPHSPSLAPAPGLLALPTEASTCEAPLCSRGG